MKFYLAFSIHGTNKFVTASIETDEYKINQDGKVVEIGGLSFKKALSRRENYKETDGMKLHSDRLLGKTGEPLRSPPMVIRFFNELEKKGWKVDKAGFIQKHWKK